MDLIQNINIALIIAGILGLFYGYWLGAILIGFGVVSILSIIYNTSEFHLSGRLIKIKNTSNYFFLKNQKTYDLIYVDGDHSSDQVTEDINNSWKLLNKGGYLILDDFMWWYYKNLNKNPSTPINNFIIKYISQIKSLKVWHQVIIEKN